MKYYMKYIGGEGGINTINQIINNIQGTSVLDKGQNKKEYK